MVALVLGLVGGCAEEGPSVANPSGTCGVSRSGARAGYHAPNGSVWVFDCQNPLHREYWRVFSDDGKVAYVIPRPDGSPAFHAACADVADPLHELVSKYSLCASASDAQQVEAVNHIALADAIRVTHFLHGQLRFVAGGVGIDPYPLPSDIVDACDLAGHTNSVELQAMCDREKDRLHSGIDIGFTYEGSGAVELAARLNELYGVAD